MSNTYPNVKILLLDSSGTNDIVTSSRIGLSMDELNVGYMQLPNLGYAGCNNLGIEEAVRNGADYIFLINNDTKIDSTAIATIIGHMRAEDDVLIAGPIIYDLVDGVPTSEIQSAGQYITFLGRARSSYPGGSGMTYVSGCAIMISRECIDRVGKLSDRYFMYYEETDYCYRARSIGKVVLVEGAKVWHKKESYQKQNNVSVYHSVRNRLWFLYQHRRPTFVIASIVITLSMAIKAARLCMTGECNIAKAYLLGLYHGITKSRS